MISAKKLLYRLLSLPLVVEAGTQDGWSYRKWSNGIMEAWRGGWGSTGSFTAWGSLFYRDIDGPSIPSGMFNATPTAFLTPLGSQAAVFGVYSVTTTRIGKIRFIHNAANDEACYANIYLFGTWK